jgi:hypothetical protein
MEMEARWSIAALHSLIVGGPREHDNPGNHSLDLCVSDRTRRRVLLHAGKRSARRGALVGGAAAGLLGMSAIALCEVLRWWHIPLASRLLPLFYVGLAISLAPIYLVTWRLARRFGWRGLALFIGIVAVIGPPRDYLIAADFPKWMVFAPGAIPIVADAVTYVGIVVLGHAVMRLIASPANEDQLARKRTKAAQATRV